MLWKALLFAFFVFAAFYFVARVVLPAAATQSDGFAAYYTASRLALVGKAGPRLYDDNWFEAQTADLTGGRSRDIYNANPPTSSLMMLPLAPFSADSARQLWTVLNVVALIAAIAVLSYATRLATEVAVLVGGMTLLSSPVYENFAHGQAYVLLLLLYAIALWAFSNRNKAVTGVMMAVMALIKMSGWPLWALMLARREWKLLLGGFGLLAAGVAASLPALGFDTWRFFLTAKIPDFLRDPANSVTAYQTIRSMSLHLFQYDALWNPHPVTDAPFLGTSVAILLTITLLGASLWLSGRMDNLHAFALFTILSVVLAPIAEEYHFVIMAVPAFVLAADLVRHPDPRFTLASLLVLVLLAVPIGYKDPALSIDAAALLAYPRLYGSSLLWVLIALQGLGYRALTRHRMPAVIVLPQGQLR